MKNTIVENTRNHKAAALTETFTLTGVYSDKDEYRESGYKVKTYVDDCETSPEDPIVTKPTKEIEILVKLAAMGSVDYEDIVYKDRYVSETGIPSFKDVDKRLQDPFRKKEYTRELNELGLRRANIFDYPDKKIIIHKGTVVTREKCTDGELHDLMKYGLRNRTVTSGNQDYDKALTIEQFIAVAGAANEKYSSIIACAGAGKTTISIEILKTILDNDDSGALFTVFNKSRVKDIVSKLSASIPGVWDEKRKVYLVSKSALRKVYNEELAKKEKEKLWDLMNKSKEERRIAAKYDRLKEEEEKRRNLKDSQNHMGDLPVNSPNTSYDRAATDIIPITVRTLDSLSTGILIKNSAYAGKMINRWLKNKIFDKETGKSNLQVVSTDDLAVLVYNYIQGMRDDGYNRRITDCIPEGSDIDYSENLRRCVANLSRLLLRHYNREKLDVKKITKVLDLVDGAYRGDDVYTEENFKNGRLKVGYDDIVKSVEHMKRIARNARDCMLNQGIITYPICTFLTVAILKSNEFLAKRYGTIIVDEAQDINGIQSEMIRRFDVYHRVLLGDESQLIYDYNGAVDHLMRDKTNKIFHITTSQRCSKAIMDVSNRILGQGYHNHAAAGNDDGFVYEIDTPSNHYIYALIGTILKIRESQGELFQVGNPSFLILCAGNDDRNWVKEHLDKGRFDNRNIEVQNVFQSKGGEADYIICWGINNYSWNPWKNEARARMLNVMDTRGRHGTVFCHARKTFFKDKSTGRSRSVLAGDLSEMVALKLPCVDIDGFKALDDSKLRALCLPDRWPGTWRLCQRDRDVVTWKLLPAVIKHRHETAGRCLCLLHFLEWCHTHGKYEGYDPALVGYKGCDDAACPVSRFVEAHCKKSSGKTDEDKRDYQPDPLTFTQDIMSSAFRYVDRKANTTSKGDNCRNVGASLRTLIYYGLRYDHHDALKRAVDALAGRMSYMRRRAFLRTLDNYRRRLQHSMSIHGYSPCEP